MTAKKLGDYIGNHINVERSDHKSTPDVFFHVLRKAKWKVRESNISFCIVVKSRANAIKRRRQWKWGFIQAKTIKR